MTIRRTAGIFLFLAITILWVAAGCKKDDFNTDPAFKLEFSSDTVIFDTVFTSIGSSMRALVIRNTGNSKVNISKISLARGNASPFRINIDGTATGELNNLEIGAKDSAYIFVKVTIDPNNVNNPMIESDSVIFETNGNIQDVKLVAWGQDAYFHHNATLTGDVTLPSDKPHVIYGFLEAAAECNLSLEAGTKLYFHNGSSLQIRKGASFNVNGTLESPVIFTNDRLEDEYQLLPGIWDGIWLENGCKNVSFTYAEITNAKVGIQADSTGLTDNNPLRLHNCMIHNMTNYGILATKSQIVATNCQITNCGGNVVSIENGGSYNFRNCTLARYFNSGKGYPALAISNFIFGKLYIKSPGALTKAYFGNCIITGNQDNEIVLYELEGTDFNFQFDRCLVNWDATLYPAAGYESNFIDCIMNEDSIFINPKLNDFQLDTLSIAIDAASINIINSTIPDITFDRKGISRFEHGLPDLGAYERVEKR